MKIFAKIRFYYGAAIIAFNTAVLMIPAIFLFNRHKNLFLHYINRMTMFMMGAKWEKEGTMDPAADLFIMNHQGIMDIVAMEAMQDNHLRWVAKKELFETPWYGLLLQKADMIRLDRSSKAGLLGLFKDVKESRASKQRQVAIFPEGTRAKTQKLLPFKSGTKMIAEKLNLKVQPVIITGSKWVLNEHDRTGHSGTIHYKFLPTIDVAEAPESWFETLHATMQKEINDADTNHHRCR